MKLAYDGLSNHLSKSLAPVYLISGDEPLLTQEAVDAIRQAAAQIGFQERQKLHANAHFNWLELEKQAQLLSLLSEKTLIELYLNSPKIGKAGGQALANYCKNLPLDKILLIISPKLTQAEQQLAWSKAINQVGVFLPIWPISSAHLPRWINARLQQTGLSADPLSIQRLAESTEGNLLATAQAVEKLSLLYGKKHLSYEEVAAALDDHAHFTLYQLIDACLAGQAEKALFILHKLKAENIANTLLLWILWQELQRLLQIKQALKDGSQPPAIIFRQLRIFDNQTSIINSALQRLSENLLQECILIASHVDKINKGLVKGDLWIELTQLTLLFSGSRGQAAGSRVETNLFKTGVSQCAKLR